MLNIFTLTWNNSEKLNKLYDSLLPSLKDIDFKWYIKDNDSKDDTVIRTAEWNKLNNNITTIPYKDNRQNFSEGCNFLFKEAAPKDDDYVMLLNNDIIFNDIHSIKNMLSVMQKDNNIGVVGARLLYTGTNKLQHAGVVFDKKYGTPTHYRLNQKSDDDAEKNREFQVVTGAVLLTKTEYYKEVFTNKSGNKGMNENYHWAFDDVDLCLSIKYNLKKKIVYCGKTNIFHEESASLKKNPTNKLFMNHNIQYLINKWKNHFVIDSHKYEKDSKYNLYTGPK